MSKGTGLTRQVLVPGEQALMVAEGWVPCPLTAVPLSLEAVLPALVWLPVATWIGVHHLASLEVLAEVDVELQSQEIFWVGHPLILGTLQNRVPGISPSQPYSPSPIIGSFSWPTLQCWWQDPMALFQTHESSQYCHFRCSTGRSLGRVIQVDAYQAVHAGQADLHVSGVKFI
jgi:hypothetical protein